MRLTTEEQLATQLLRARQEPGVEWRAHMGKWAVSIRDGEFVRQVGLFDTYEDAIGAYYEKAPGTLQRKPLDCATPSNALAKQEGGKHYKELTIQPVEYIHRNKLGFCEGSVIKYITRWRAKGGVEDLRKARHFIDLLIEMEGGAA